MYMYIYIYIYIYIIAMSIQIYREVHILLVSYPRSLPVLSSATGCHVACIDTYHGD